MTLLPLVHVLDQYVLCIAACHMCNTIVAMPTVSSTLC